MAVRSVSGATYYLIGRLPLIVLAVFVLWVAMQGLLHLEMYSFGTEFLVGNDETANVMPMPRSDTDIAMDALASGDQAQMEAALDEIENRHGGVPAG